MRTLAVLALACCFLFLLAPGSALAQSQDFSAVMNRLEALQRDLRDLQSYVYAGGGAAEEGEGLPLSDEARRRYADLDVRLSTLEDQLRALTGQHEELGYRLQQIEARLDKLVGDVDVRLRELEAGRAALAPTGGAPAETGPVPLETPQPSAASEGAAPGYVASEAPTVLGTIPAESLTPGSAPAEGALPVQGAAPTEGALLPDAPVPEQYAYALDQVQAMQRLAGTPEAQAAIGRSEAALTSFIELHPNDPLVENASYWLGETYYFAHDYERAVVTFARNYQTYPEGRKAPENLLKLGMSYVGLGQKAEACAAFAKLLQTFPNASAGVIQRTQQEAASAGCP